MKNEKDPFTLQDSELNKLVNLAADLDSGRGGQEAGMEFVEVLDSIEKRLKPQATEDREDFEAYITGVLKIPATRDAEGAYVHLDARTSWHVWKKSRGINQGDFHGTR